MNQVQHILPHLKRLIELEEARSFRDKDSASHASLSAEIALVRATLPTAILRHHDSRMLRGKKSLAPVTGGVCGACHLAIPRGRLGDLRKIREDLNVCDHCGVFIYFAEGPPSASPDRLKHAISTAAKTVRPPRKPKTMKIAPTH